MSEVSQGAMAAIAVLRELTNVGICAVLNCEGTDATGRWCMWMIRAHVGSKQVSWRVHDGEVTASGDWVRYAANVVHLISDTLRPRMPMPKVPS